MGYDRAAFDDFLVTNNCIRIGNHYTLASGRTTRYHINLKDFDVENYKRFRQFVESFIREMIEQPELYTFVGVPFGASILGCNISEGIGSGRQTIARKKPHDRAERPVDRYFTGPNLPAPGEKIICIEDALSTGHDLVESIDQARKAGAEVKCAVVLCDRRELPAFPGMSENCSGGKSTKERMESSREVKIYTMTDVHSLLPYAIKIICPENTSLIGAILAEYSTHGADAGAYDRMVHVNELSAGAGMAGKGGLNVYPTDKLNTRLLQRFVEKGLLTLETSPE